MTGWGQVFIPLLAMAINAVAHILLFRTVLNGSLLKSLLAGFGIGFLTITIYEGYLLMNGAASAADVFPMFMVNQSIHFALWYIFFNFVNMTETARRIRLMRELVESPQGLTYEQILQKYNAKEMVDRRIDRLTSKAQIIKRGDRFYPGKPIVLFIARVVIFMKLFILGKASEYD